MFLECAQCPPSALMRQVGWVEEGRPSSVGHVDYTDGMAKRKNVRRRDLWLSFAMRRTMWAPQGVGCGNFSLGQRDRAQHEHVLWATSIGHSPDRAVSVLADEKGAVTRHGHPDGTRPN
jgi:hypothetical protein